MEITKGIIPKAKKIVIYGPEGIGKSTFASKFPSPVFIDTEGSTSSMDVARLPDPKTWKMIEEEIDYISKHSKECKTLVIDTADWAEKLCITSVCEEKRVEGIEDIGYGKGYTYIKEKFTKLLNELQKLVDVGINVVMTAHAQMRKFEQPDEMGAYDRWELKLSKQTSPLLKEWTDMLLFATYKTNVVKTQDGKLKARGDKRVIYTQHRPCWDAKNRYGLPEEIDMNYESIQNIIEDGTVTAIVNDLKENHVKTSLEELHELIERDNIDPEDLKIIAFTKNWIDNTIDPIDEYPEKIIRAFVKSWAKVPALIEDISKNNEIPFK